MSKSFSLCCNPLACLNYQISCLKLYVNYINVYKEAGLVKMYPAIHDSSNYIVRSIVFKLGCIIYKRTVFEKFHFRFILLTDISILFSSCYAVPIELNDVILWDICWKSICLSRNVPVTNSWTWTQQFWHTYMHAYKVRSHANFHRNCTRPWPCWPFSMSKIWIETLGSSLLIILRTVTDREKLLSATNISTDLATLQLPSN